MISMQTAPPFRMSEHLGLGFPILLEVPNPSACWPLHMGLQHGCVETTDVSSKPHGKVNQCRLRFIATDLIPKGSLSTHLHLRKLT